MIYQCSALCGAGKTQCVVEDFERNQREGQGHLVAQPTIGLMNETKRRFEERDHIVEDFNRDVARELSKAFEDDMYSRPAKRRYVNELIVGHMKNPLAEPHVLLMTHTALTDLPYIHRPQDWNLFVDEVPQIYEFVDFKAMSSHQFLTDYVSIRDVGGGYGILHVENQRELRRLIEAAVDDDGLEGLANIAKRISGDWVMYMKIAQFNDLREGETGRVFGLLVMKPSRFEQFRSATILSAFFEDSLAYHLMKLLGANFKVSPLSAHMDSKVHTNGRCLEIVYMTDSMWSQTFRRSNDDVMQRIVAVVLQEFGVMPFLYSENEKFKGRRFHGQAAERLPGRPEGLNEYRDYNNIAFLSAYNLSKDQAALLVGMGISQKTIRKSIYFHAVYQAVMRSALRNFDDMAPKKIIVVDKDLAEWLHDLFPGSTLRFHDAGLAEFAPNKAGRPKVHKDNAAKTAACRAKKKATSATKLIVNNHIDNGCNEISYKESYLQNMDHALQVTVVPDLRKTETRSVEMTLGRFVKLLEWSAQRSVDTKEANVAVCPATFVDVPGVTTTRGKYNVEGCYGLWLDIDGGDLTPALLAQILPDEWLICWNTYNCTPQKLKWRAFFPTSRSMTAAEYCRILRVTRHSVEAAGCVNHGIDRATMHEAAHFYLPCQAADGVSNFFEHHGSKGKLLNVGEWLAKAVFQGPKVASVASSDFAVAIAHPQGVEEIIAPFRDDMLTPGRGDKAFCNAAFAMSNSGYGRDTIKAALGSIAASAPSPADRLSQISRLLPYCRPFDRADDEDDVA